MFVLFLSFLGILLSFVILRFNPKNKYLAAFYFLNSIHGAFAVSLFYFKIPLLSVILLIHIFPLFYLLGPCIYFYYRMELTKSSAFKKSDLLHFLPFGISLLLILPYVFQSIDYKYQFVGYFHDLNLNAVDQMNVVILPIRVFLIGKNLHQLAYLIYISFWYYKIRKTNPMVIRQSQKKWLDFLTLTLLISNILIVLLTLLSLYKLNKGEGLSPYPTLFLASSLGAVMYISIFFFPNILYNEVKKQAEPRNLVTPEEIQIQQLEQTIQEYLINDPFLSSDFTKPRMMSDLKISDRLFTYYFNEFLGGSFVEWRSDLRIDYSYQLILNGYLNNHTIESLAQKVGFLSRNKFTEAFKKRKGINPSEVNK